MMTWMKVLESDELSDGAMKGVTLSGTDRLAVYRVGGAYYATSDICTHAIASLSEGWLEDYHVICPVHSGEFDIRTGAAKCFPATLPIKTYPTRIDSDGVWVNIQVEGQ